MQNIPLIHINIQTSIPERIASTMAERIQKSLDDGNTVVAPVCRKNVAKALYEHFKNIVETVVIHGEDDDIIDGISMREYKMKIFENANQMVPSTTRLIIYTQSMTAGVSLENFSKSNVEIIGYYENKHTDIITYLQMCGRVRK
jgi:hypothetical protein